MDPDGALAPPVQNQSDQLPTSSSDPAANVSIPPNDPISAVPGIVPPLSVQDPPPTTPMEPTAPLDTPTVAESPVSPLGGETISSPPMPESFVQTPPASTQPLTTPPAFDQPLSPAAAPQDPPTLSNQPAADPSPAPIVQAGSGKVKLLAIIAFLLAIATAVLFFVTRIMS